jgi:hypothetical protein
MTNDKTKESLNEAASHSIKEDNGELVKTQAKEMATDFIKEQYIQLNEHRRQVNTFSWQTPAIFFGALVLLLSLNANSLKDWRDAPCFPAIGFLAVTGFIIVMLSSHIRNRVVRDWLDDLIGKMESQHGKRPHDYGCSDGPPGRQPWELAHSSDVLTKFLIFLALLTAGAAIYFLVLLIKQLINS